jgi:hypothetical protein
MRRISMVGRVVVALVIAVAWSGSVFADAVLVPNVLDAAKATEDVGVTLTDQTSSNVFIQQCWRSDQDPKFDLALDCSQFNTVNPVIVNGKGKGVITVFNGDDPNLGEWSCGTKGSSGIPNSATCYLRMSPEVIDDLSNDQFIPITWSNNPPPTPSTLPPATVPGFTTTVPGGAVPTTANGGSVSTTVDSGSVGTGDTTTSAGSTPVDGASTTVVGDGSGPVGSSTTVLPVIQPSGGGNDTPWALIVVVVAAVGGLGGYFGVRSSRKK